MIGCASFADIRQSEPIKTLSIDGQAPRNIANCSLYELKTENGLSPIFVEKDGSCFIMLKGDPDFGYAYNFGELSFKPQGKGTLIELRTSTPGSWAKDQIWSSVIKCAAPQNSPGK
jgi:hypothetical protein